MPSLAPSWPEMAATLDTLRPPRGLFVLATLRAEPIGCGGLKLPPGEPAELKRMWIAEHARGLGVGRRLLGELERRAAEHGARTIRLETNGTLTEALGALPLERLRGHRGVQRHPARRALAREAAARGVSGYQRELRPRRLV